jgi:hypothetical protein
MIAHVQATRMNKQGHYSPNFRPLRLRVSRNRVMVIKIFHLVWRKWQDILK